MREWEGVWNVKGTRKRERERERGILNAAGNILHID